MKTDVQVNFLINGLMGEEKENIGYLLLIANILP